MDKKLNEVTKVTDMAYVPVIMADGSIGQIAKSDLASVVAGVIGVATNKKNGLLEASSFVKLLSSNYILYKIASIGSNVWSRKSFSIKGAYNAIPYEYIGGIYYTGSTSSFAVNIKSVLSKQSHIKFYEKGGDIYVFFNIQSQDLNYALFSSEHEITQMSIGNQSIIDSSYTEIDVTSDVFGYNSLAELSAGVATEMGLDVLPYGYHSLTQSSPFTMNIPKNALIMVSEIYYGYHLVLFAQNAKDVVAKLSESSGSPFSVSMSNGTLIVSVSSGGYDIHVSSLSFN